MLDASTYLDSLASSVGHKPNVQKALRDARDSYDGRLWHELGEALLVAIEDDHVRQVAYDLHQHVLLPCRADISPFAYAKLLYVIALYGDQPEPNKALALLDGAFAMLTSQLPSGMGEPQAIKCVQCIRAMVLMSDEATVEARRLLDEVADYAKERQAHDLDPVLSALLARARVREYELLREFTSFYETAFDVHASSIRAGIPIVAEDLSVLSYKVVVAALLSPKVYNFGKLLNYEPFIACLRSSTDAWLLQWAQLCNDGDVKGFEAFVVAHAGDIGTIEDLKVALPTLGRKVRLMALLHLVFYTPADERVFSFASIAERCGLASLEQVEPLLLTAFACHIVKGHIDGLAEMVHITWVQPRVLSSDEILQLAKLIGAWKSRVAAAREQVDALAANITP